MRKSKFTETQIIDILKSVEVGRAVKDVCREQPHRSLGGKTPIEKLNELSDKPPLREEVAANFDPSKEHILEQNYRDELALRKLK